MRTTPPQARAFRIFGVSDPEGFAAMGVVETLVHIHDLAEGLGLAWVPPAELCARGCWRGLCARVLARQFPDVPRDSDPWAALLWDRAR